MPLLNLPVELLTKIAQDSIKHGSNGHRRLNAIKNLRLTCKYLAKIFAAATFETTNLSPDQSSYKRFKNLQNDPVLSLFVRTVVLNTYAYRKPIRNADKEWLRLAASIGNFPNLQSIHVNFHDDIHEESQSDLGETVQYVPFRKEVLRTLFAALNSPKYPAPNLRSLTIQNLQPINIPEITQSTDFGKVLSRLKELHLYITREEDTLDQEYVLEYPTLHEFFRDLPSVWLEPTKQNLTHLTIHGGKDWGWFPKFDPRGLHFPNLKYLALGAYSFAHDWQVEWVISHGHSLETLILDDAAIVFFNYPYRSWVEDISPMSHDNHKELKFREAESGDFGDNLGVLDNKHPWDIEGPAWGFERRWHHYFAKFEAGLPHLTKFGFGDLNFEQGDILQPHLHYGRYIAFDGNTPFPWHYPEADNTFGNVNIENDSHGMVHLVSPAILEPPYRLTATRTPHANSYTSSEVSVSLGVVVEMSCWCDRMGKCRKSLDRKARMKGCQREDQDAFMRILDTVSRRAREKCLT